LKEIGTKAAIPASDNSRQQYVRGSVNHRAPR
jgi:hypothetical protein